jgi:hypothetical protein
MLNSSSRRINAILELMPSPARYLEIGVETGQTFFEVSAEYKTAVDPTFCFDWKSEPPNNSIEYHEVTSDMFFSQVNHSIKYDLVFLDGLHTWDQTYRDFCNSLLVTHDKSIIILDDIFPCDVYSCNRDQAEAVLMRGFMTGDSSNAWHGDTYKVIPLIQAFHSSLSFCTIISDGNPQSVVWRSVSASKGDGFKPFFSDLSTLNLAALDYIWFLQNQQSYGMMSEHDAIACVGDVLGSGHTLI